MTVKATFNSLLDQAVDKMGPLRKRAYQRRLKDKQYREAITDELILKLSQDERVQAMNLPIFAEASAPGSDQVTAMGGNNGPRLAAADVELQLDPDKIKQLLDLLIEYGPKIFDLIMRFFG